MSQISIGENTMSESVIGTFGCESYQALAWHIASCHWKMQTVPEGLIDDLRGLDSFSLETLKNLRAKYVHPESESVLG